MSRSKLAAVREWGTGRSSLFDAYLATRTATERLQFLAAERIFIRENGERLATATHVFRECMRGFAETPSGPGSRQPHQAVGVVETLGGDWSWKPERDAVVGESMKTFKGVPPSAAELYRRGG